MRERLPLAGEIGEYAKQSVIDDNPDNSPLLFCPTLQGRGGYLLDRSSIANHGTITSATWVRLASGLKCLYFDGTNDWVTFTHDATYNTTPLTCEAWVNCSNAAAERTIIMKEGAGAAMPFIFAVNTGFILFHFYNGAWHGSADTAAAKIADTWEHLAFTYDGTNCIYYLNGAAGDTVFIGGALPTNALSVHMGKYRYGGADANLFEGYIALCRVYGSALSAAELLRHYNRERSLFGV
jgi:hypothetical protein